ncbi:hypothetical protein FPV67DRAFT_1667692 [Lyophyllum atratum]|nr:hypothetical protein FPV67DRAFT_1667692 [Lyophyllum atratum]
MKFPGGRTILESVASTSDSADPGLSNTGRLALKNANAGRDIGPLSRKESEDGNTGDSSTMKFPGGRAILERVASISDSADPGASNTGRLALKNANAGRDIGRLSRKESEDANTGDSSTTNFPGGLAVLQSVASTPDSAEGERFQDLVYCDDAGRWRCRGPQCGGMIFSTKSSARRHVDQTMAHAPDKSRRPFLCDKCGKSFARLETLSRHDRLEHARFMKRRTQYPPTRIGTHQDTPAEPPSTAT